jgi:hypothetical protein
MSTAKDLIDFANNNGIFIHGRTSPQEWEQLLAENDGRCPCGHAEQCPCEDALKRINDPAKEPPDQMCGCAFYVSGAYLKHYHRAPWGEATPSTPSATSTEKSKPKPNDGSISYQKTRNVPADVEEAFIRSAGTYIDALKLIETGNIDEFVDKIRIEEATNQCDICKGDADIVASHGEFVRALCKHGSSECEEEVKKLVTRTMSVIDENFLSAGYDKVQGTSAIAEEEKPGKKNAWIEFSSKVMADPRLDGLPQKNKMKIAASLYRGEHASIEEAREALKNE